MKITTKKYTKPQMIQHFFRQLDTDEAFILFPKESAYTLVQDAEQWDLERMMSKKEILNYVTAEHIIYIISDIKDFLTSNQVNLISQEIEEF